MRLIAQARMTATESRNSQKWGRLSKEAGVDKSEGKFGLGKMSTKCQRTVRAQETDATANNLGVAGMEDISCGAWPDTELTSYIL